MANILEDVLGTTIKQKRQSKKKVDEVTNRDKGASDFQFFATHYFPHIFSAPLCNFHIDMFKDVENMILNFDGLHNKFVRGAPRGHGKSRIISVAAVLWIICYGYRRNIMLIADTSSQSKEYIQTIKAELEDNVELKKDFGILVGDEKWREDEIITGNDIHVISKSSGQSLRGSSYKNIRPEVVILDDLENDENVETESQRQKLYNWFMKVLMPIGNPRTVFLYVGSVLHYESLLYKVLTESKYNDWSRRLYRAVDQFSSSPLWDEWRDIFNDLSRDNPSDEAYQFFCDNADEMMKGVEIMWGGRDYSLFANQDIPYDERMEKSRRSWYYKLMVLKLQDDDAFNSEYQNNPMTEDSRIFKEEWIKRNYYETLPQLKEIYGSVDVSMGKSRTGDTSAIIFVGRGVDNFLYVLEADICRRSPDIIIRDLIGYFDKYSGRITGFIVEENVFQEFFSKTLQETCRNMGLYINFISARSSTGDSKPLRIRSLAPKIQQGYLKFNQGQTVLIQQLKNFPKDHDDGPDALERCINQMINTKSSVFFTNTAVKKQDMFNQMIRGWRR